MSVAFLIPESFGNLIKMGKCSKGVASKEASFNNHEISNVFQTCLCYLNNVKCVNIVKTKTQDTPAESPTPNQRLNGQFLVSPPAFKF